MTHLEIDILSVIVIFFDLVVSAFLTWRIFDKKATLWGASKFIYGWVTLLTLYHCAIYITSLFVREPNRLISQYLHPVVLLFVLNPFLIAIIQWRGGKLWN
jgi:hypothetical protein